MQLQIEIDKIKEGIEEGEIRKSVNGRTPTIFKMLGYDGKVFYGWNYQKIGINLDETIQTKQHQFMANDCVSYSYVWQYSLFGDIL